MWEMRQKLLQLIKKKRLSVQLTGIMSSETANNCNLHSVLFGEHIVSGSSFAGQILWRLLACFFPGNSKADLALESNRQLLSSSVSASRRQQMFSGVACQKSHDFICSCDRERPCNNHSHITSSHTIYISVISI